MDWTMVNNAKGPIHRIQTIFYLFRFRYEADARTAAIQLAEESPSNQLCKQTIAELRAELVSPSTNLGLVRVTDTDVREYLENMLEVYDETIGKSK
jgi:hypothetical protein